MNSRFITHTFLYPALLVLLLSSAACSYAPDGVSRTPYTPVFRAFLGVGVSLASVENRCNLDALSDVGLQGQNRIPLISWIDAPAVSDRFLRSYYIGIFSNTNNRECSQLPDSGFRCTHVIFSVDAEEANYSDGLTANSGEVSDAASTTSTYVFSENAWQATNPTQYGEIEYVGACQAGNDITYRVVVIASIRDAGELFSDQYVTYDSFVDMTSEGQLGLDIIDIAEFDVTNIIQ